MNRDKVICPCYQVTKAISPTQWNKEQFKEVKKLTKAGKGWANARRK